MQNFADTCQDSIGQIIDDSFLALSSPTSHSFCNMVQDRGGGSLSHFGKTVNVGLLNKPAKVRGVRGKIKLYQLNLFVEIHEHINNYEI